ncbi:CMP-sialic acid transporter 2-like isoform X2 [Panicum virgatum]|uniref:CMP-sialic acid transporter 2-like isoform X2 n=1 Tax=Panicum virgatum TaxID=38727 RepID=UPI0019D55FB9|nr:CMP-sialic acid transporter 2-like isoform X2 [Panicum virgatum]XP_039805860.1 CMP-sialic acid transporter 2-like isoform X2 [Panicum virgatum]XP_039805861.1 CMP-sialic acid transporter 2-like isoform X2 [Panicum virgatum]
MKLPHSCYTLHGEELVAVLYLCICGCTSLPDPEKLEYYQHRCLIPYHSKEKLSEIQWAAFILLCAGCTIAQLNPSSDHVLQTPIQGWMMAIVMALLSGFASVYTEAIIKKRSSRNINVRNFWLYIFGMLFNLVAICVQNFDAMINKLVMMISSFHAIISVTVHDIELLTTCTSAQSWTLSLVNIHSFF